MVHCELERILALPSGSVAPIMAVSSADRYDTMWIKPRVKEVGGLLRQPKLRQIFAPRGNLKDVQRQIGRFITSRFKPHPVAHAYVRRRGIITNAQTHLGASRLLHIDLVNFFGSIKQPAIVDALCGLLDNCPPDIVAVIADICCRDGRLPQGSPASPSLSNLICLPLDAQLANLARSTGCSLGRYSDDIGISTAAAAFAQEIASLRNGKIEVGQPLLSLIEEHGFDVNWAKVRYQTRRTGLKATGLMIGDKVTVPREFRDNVRADLHRWTKDGRGDAARRCRPPRSEKAFVQSLRGSIDFVGQVEGRDSSSYRRLMQPFNLLCARDRP